MSNKTYESNARMPEMLTLHNFIIVDFVLTRENTGQ